MLNRIVCADALEFVSQLPDESVDCCITSPPYFKLRNFGIQNEIGSEDTVESYLLNLVVVFAQVHRVLKKRGTLWVNIGDSYAGKPGGGSTSHRHYKGTGYKPGKAKDLLGVPWSLAFALRAQGWYLRQDIIWHKTNCMPESVKDRFNKSHDHIFLLTKSAHYYFNSNEIRERVADGLLRPKRDVWQIAVSRSKLNHFAVMPDQVVVNALLPGCPPGGVVLDPFVGTGTVGEIALRSGRSFLGCDLNRNYVDAANDRLRHYINLFTLQE